jgi:hypothetical protein
LSKQLSKADSIISAGMARVRFTEIEMAKQAPYDAGAYLDKTDGSLDRWAPVLWTADLDTKLVDLVSEMLYDFDAVATELQHLFPTQRFTADAVRCRFALCEGKGKQQKNGQ